VTYSFRTSFPLNGMVVSQIKSASKSVCLCRLRNFGLSLIRCFFFSSIQDYLHCIQLSQKGDNKVLITFNARNEHDRCKFTQDLEESIAEMDEMEQIRIEAELDRQQKKSRSSRNLKNSIENRDSGYAETEAPKTSASTSDLQAMQMQNHRNKQLSNSLLDINEQSKLSFRFPIRFLILFGFSWR